MAWDSEKIMSLILQDNLLFTTVKIGYRGVEIVIDNVLIDTGSVSTLLSVDSVEKAAIFPEPDDALHIMRGVGGSEVVFMKQLDYLAVEGYQLPLFAVEIGAMDYGFVINGILEMDFLLQAGAILDLKQVSLVLPHCNNG
jgi:hypothetical protein